MSEQAALDRVERSPASPTARVDDIGRRIVETDRRYFEMGGETVRLPGADLATVRALSHCPSATVVQRVSPAAVVRHGSSWVRCVEEQVRRLGCPLARIYLDDDRAAVASVLESAGYEKRREIALSAPAADVANAHVELREVTSDADWRRKVAFHEAVAERPDGHDAPARDWASLERAKCAAGMRAFLAWREGEAVGAICAIPSPGLWRLKNIVVHGAHRRQSIGRGMIAGIARMARQAGASQLCLFGVAETPGEALYRACGFAEAGVQIEWSRRLV